MTNIEDQEIYWKGYEDGVAYVLKKANEKFSKMFEKLILEINQKCDEHDKH